MTSRPLWLDSIHRAWSHRSVVWLSGVRRVGKTTLVRMLPDAQYMNCDLPSVVRALEDPELFLRGRRSGSALIFDEVHQLPDPSLLLKLAADEHPKLKVLATGSSTLAATGKFRDSLAGRKASVHLCPVLWEECASGFNAARADTHPESPTATDHPLPSVATLDRRLLHGGLPEVLLAESAPVESFSEWIDSFYARDILELFAIRNRQGFLALFRLLLRRSGGQTSYGRLASLAELSRPTVKSYLDALEVVHAVHRLRPFHGDGSREIVRRPKYYAFDTGFVAFERGWRDIRPDDRSVLWEHLVLDALRFRHLDENVFYWQDKSGREVDFVVRRERNRVDLIECNIDPDKLNPSAASAFRARYPEGDNYVATPFAHQPYQLRRADLVFTACVPSAVPGDPSMIGALLGTREARMAAPAAMARVRGRPFDPTRLEMFATLCRTLRDYPPRPLPAPTTAPEAQRTLAFYDAYFSNFIEGTEFDVEEAAQIAFTNVIPRSRPADAHDIAGTWGIVSDDAQMRQTPTDFDDFLALLRNRHRQIMKGRPETRPGHFKTKENRAGATVFVAPELVVGTLEQGFGLYRSLEWPFGRAVFLMFLVSEVHPFADGNGRLARVMMNAELCAVDQPRVVVPTVFRLNYLAGLRALSRTGNAEPLVQVLEYAQRWTAAVPWRSVLDTKRELEACNAFLDANEAEDAGVRLRMPGRVA